MTEFVIRPAREDDASLLAWAVIEAARSHRPRGFWDLWVPDAEARLAFVERLLVEAIARATPFFGCMHETPPGAWLVESVATRPEARGQGLGAALVEHVLGDGRRRGHSDAKLSLMIGNSAAQRLYERAGFAITAEKRDAALDAAIGCPGVAQMSCPL